MMTNPPQPPRVTPRKPHITHVTFESWMASVFGQTIGFIERRRKKRDLKPGNYQQA